jgi:YVTN family beta-propeller protein
LGLLATAAVVAALLGTGPMKVHPPGARGAHNVVDTIPMGNGPIDVAMNPAAGLVYVANQGSQDLRIVDYSPPTVLVPPPIPVGGNVFGVAFDSAHNVVFVTDHQNSVIMPYQATSPFNVVGGPIATGANPFGVAVNPNTNRLYSANENQPDVAVFDSTPPGFAFQAPLPQAPCAPGPGFAAGSQPSGVAVNTNNNLHFYVTLTGANQLWIMDGVVPPWACPPPIPVGNQPVGVAFNPANDHIYVANRGSNDVTIVDANPPHAVLNPSLPVGPAPWGVAVNPTTNKIYVTNSGANTVSVIDGATDAVVETVTVGAGPRGVAVDPLLNRVFVANFRGNNLSVLEDVPAVPPPPPPPPPPGGGPPPPGGPTEQISLQGGTCTPVASTYQNATPIGTIAGAVTPTNVLRGLWEFDGVTWYGYSPQAPAAGNLPQLDRLDVVFICVSGSGPGAATFTRPVI